MGPYTNLFIFISKVAYGIVMPLYFIFRNKNKKDK